MVAKKPNEPRGLIPVINHIPPAELKLYTVVEQDLLALAKGSPSDLFLNFATALLGIAFTSAVTLMTTQIGSNKTLVFFVCALLVTFINGTLLLILWGKNHQSTKGILRRIMEPPLTPPAIQERTPEPPSVSA